MNDDFEMLYPFEMIYHSERTEVSSIPSFLARPLFLPIHQQYYLNQLDLIEEDPLLHTSLHLAQMNHLEENPIIHNISQYYFKVFHKFQLICHPLC